MQAIVRRRVKLDMEKDDLRIVPAAYDLETLLVKVTPENLHGETETGLELGKEIW